MDEGKFVADFIAKNIEKIWGLSKQGLGVADELIQIKLKTAYKDYLTNTREKYSKSKSFFIRNHPVDLYSYYVPTGIGCDGKTISTPTFDDCVNFSSRIVITGSGGSGKSVLMRHLFLDCIGAKKFTPILIELRDLNNDERSLDDFITYTLDLFGFKISGEYVKRAKQAGHFCFFFDGYDEVNPSQKKKLIEQICNLSKKFPDCPIILSSRPDDTFNGIDDFCVFGILPLDLDSATNLVSKLPFDELIKAKFISDLKDGLFEQHESFLSNPLLLSIMLLTYGENAEIPSKLSIFYNQAYEALFQRHDANKGGYSRKRLTILDIQDFSRVFALFSLQTYEKGLFKMSRTDCLDFIEKSKVSLRKEFKSEDYLNDLLSAACLLIEDGLEIAFSHRSFQEYFVALHISSASPEIQSKLIQRYSKNIRSDNVMNLLLELNPDLVERELFIPHLESLFSEIGVKRAVGITHMARYFKKCYSSLNIDSNGLSTISASPHSNINVNSIVHMVIQHCGTYTFPSPEYFEKHHIEMHKKYCHEEERVVFSTKKLTHRSPVLVDTFKSEGAFSIAYLTAAFVAFKKLKLKHSTIVHSLDVLLGIR